MAKRNIDREREQALGELIYIHRTQKGLSRIHLATTLRISQQQLRKYETGKDRVSALKLKDISKALGVPVTVFLGE